MNPGSEGNRNEGDRQARRKAVMLVLTHSGAAEIARCLETVGVSRNATTSSSLT